MQSMIQATTAPVSEEKPRESEQTRELGVDFRRAYDATLDLLREKRKTDSVRLSKIPTMAPAPT